MWVRTSLVATRYVIEQEILYSLPSTGWFQGTDSRVFPYKLSLQSNFNEFSINQTTPVTVENVTDLVFR